MSDDSTADGRFAWLHWPTLLKGIALGIGAGLIIAVAIGDFYAGMLIGVVNGVAFGLGRSHARSR